MKQPVDEATAKQLELVRRKSPSPPPDDPSKGKVQPIMPRTDFTLQQHLVGIGKSKDLDEWLMGSGESAETTDSKLNNTRKLLEKPV